MGDRIPLPKWIDFPDWEWNSEAKRAIRQGSSFSFKMGCEVIVVHKGHVGNLKQWSAALSIPYSTIGRRKLLGWPLAEVLRPSQKPGPHRFLSHEKRMACTCQGCRQYAWRYRKRNPVDLSSPCPALIKASPSGVLEPKLWAKIDGTRFVFKYQGQYKTIADWASCAGLSEAALYQRLVVLGYPIKRAMEKTKPGHGTRSYYSYHGCRCEACKEANRAYSQGVR